MTWDAVVFGFLLFWMTGVVAELQRSELFGVEKFLHLPVTLGGVFLMNYLTSFVSITLIVFVPAMTGLILALARTHGSMQLFTFVPMAALVFAVTAVTYQFRGWIAAMMTNPRRRKFVISLITMIFVLIVQIPNFVNLAMQSGSEPGDVGSRARKRITRAAYPSGRHADGRSRQRGRADRLASLCGHGGDRGALRAGADRERLPVADRRGQSAALVPDHDPHAHRRFHGTARPPRRAPATRPATNRTLLVERSVPGLSEHASAIATTSLRSLLRAPEAKIMLMTPVIMVLIFGVMFLTRSFRPAPEYRPVIAFGALASGLLSMGNLVINPFGFDRAGFRALVMSSADRRDILIGKNLSIAPLVFGLQTVLVTLIQIVLPLRLDQLLALVPQALTMFVLFCLLSNLAAIFAPGAIAAGTMKPSGGSGTTQMIRLAIVFALPIVLSIALAPYGIEMLLDKLLGIPGPYMLALSLILAALAGLFYWVAIGWEAWLLQRRELDILAVVAAKAE